MKVWIDQDLCTGDGLCEEIAPAVFTLLDDGLAYVKEGDAVKNEPGGSGRHGGRARASSRTPWSRPPRSAPASASSSSATSSAPPLLPPALLPLPRFPAHRASPFGRPAAPSRRASSGGGPLPPDPGT